MKTKGKIILTTMSVILVFFLILSSVTAAKAKNDTGHEGSNEGLTERLAKLETIVTNLNQTNSTMQQTIQSQKGELISMKTDVSSLASEVVFLKTQIATITSNVYSLTTDVSSLKSDIATLVSQNKQMDIRLAKLEQSVQPPQSGIGFRVSGVMKDASGKMFFSSFALFNEQTGKYYSQSNFNLSRHDTGAFEFIGVPDGTYTLQYNTGPNYIIDFPKQIIVSGSDINGLEVKLAVKTYTVSGRVVDANGNPSLIGHGVGISNQYGISGGYWPVIGPDGTFIVAGLAPGNYNINIGEFQFPSASTNVTVTDQDILNVSIIYK